MPGRVFRERFQFQSGPAGFGQRCARLEITPFLAPADASPGAFTAGHARRPEEEWHIVTALVRGAREYIAGSFQRLFFLAEVFQQVVADDLRPGLAFKHPVTGEKL